MGNRLSTSRIRGDGSPWSELNHDVLFLVMMKLEAIDFLAFSGVCKSWNSLALQNKIRFMSSRPPMALWISKGANNMNEYSLEGIRGRRFQMQLPKSDGRTCVGLTCGYLVLFGTKPCDFLLMNPITRHGICFPNFPSKLYPDRYGVRAILVISPSIFTWVLVVLCRYTTNNPTKIWFSIAGKGAWDYVSSKSRIIDLHEFKGKIYAIATKNCLYEVGLDPKPKLTLLRTKYIPKNIRETGHLVSLEFVCSDENLYVMECFSKNEYKVYKLDFGEMKWVALSSGGKNTEEYAFCVSGLKHSAAIKRGLWSEFDSWLRYICKRFGHNVNSTRGKNMFLKASIWYFPHDCLKVNLIHQ